MCAGDVITAKIDQSNQCVREKILNPKDILALAYILFSFCRGTVVNKFCFLVSFPVLVSKIEQNINSICLKTHWGLAMHFIFLSTEL